MWRRAREPWRRRDSGTTAHTTDLRRRSRRRTARPVFSLITRVRGTATRCRASLGQEFTAVSFQLRRLPLRAVGMPWQNCCSSARSAPCTALTPARAAPAPCSRPQVELRLPPLAAAAVGGLRSSCAATSEMGAACSTEKEKRHSVRVVPGVDTIMPDVLKTQFVPPSARRRWPDREAIAHRRGDDSTI